MTCPCQSVVLLVSFLIGTSSTGTIRTQALSFKFISDFINTIRLAEINFRKQKQKENMPLILICGFPSSGKTKRATELKERLEDNYKKVVNVISDHSLGVNRNSVYKGIWMSFRTPPIFVKLSVTSRFAPKPFPPKSFRLYFHPWSFLHPHPGRFAPNTIFPLPPQDVPPPSHSPPQPSRFAPNFGNVLYACLYMFCTVKKQHVHVLYSEKIQFN